MRGLGGLLPFATNTGQKPAAGFAVLIECLITTVTVNACCRRAEKHAGLVRKLRDGFAQQMRPVHATVMNLPFLLFSPATFGDVFAGQINDCVKACELFRVDCVLIWMPLDLVSAR